MAGRVLAVLLAIVVIAGAGYGLYLLNQPPERPVQPAAVSAPAPAGAPAASPRSAPARPIPKERSAETTPAPEAAPATGTLIIESDVPETSVFIDRVYLGNAPVTARNLTPGAHRLNMSVTGFEGVSETIEVKAGTQTISMKFKEIRLDEKADVTHKHGIGSCSGTLRATPQRLSYETTNASDAFAAALTNLDTFEMDYIAKTLKVKVRDGKTYNFTEHGGNVDRLYAFHQSVEKVRQRLLAGRRP